LRKLFYTIVILVSVTSAMAASNGTPDQDPVIKDLIEDFTLGKQPDTLELLKHTYVCNEIVALRDRFDGNSFTIKFSMTPGGLMQTSKTKSNGKLFVGNGKELIASFVFKINSVENVGSIAFRVDQDGYLLGEYSTTNMGGLKGELDPIAATPATGYKVRSYIVCTVSP
jgi:hypothetical protein